MSRLELFAAVVGALSVWLSTRQRLWAWPTAIVNVLLYAKIFFDARLYADMGLQFVYAALSVYGWWQWRYGGAQHTPRPVTRTPARQWPLLALAAAAGALLVGWSLARFTDAAIPYLDSALTATSLVAQWMMTRKQLENWLLWIAVDVVYVPVYAARGLPATAVLYAVFLALAVAGYAAWRRDWQARHGAPLPAPA
ncbi:nicotinamide riboside transporter PnuC [Roseisolibacter sp. H3M3-2]|uniref:nicotinamide riboside transporter PnuC n=1 Tax=Roseisolibacter sp. H3M3-2 TaxID=3031323 RepID=UPI0023D9AA8F|nr:nicotinamide riboside transporter PnuC [Roseisolibacter sp. H3M3-2]MDF1502357.1 nicotinamide riboside transporter PnuC [Roseisolibacter sp. H3M3-2]